MNRKVTDEMADKLCCRFHVVYILAMQAVITSKNFDMLHRTKIFTYLPSNAILNIFTFTGDLLVEHKS